MESGNAPVDGLEMYDEIHGSPWHDEYLQTAPRPDDLPGLVERIKD